MNKKQALLSALVTLAAGPALAQSSVTAFGLIDMSIGTGKVAGTNASIKTADSGKMTTSHFGFRGMEDLGGGVAATFQLESFLRADIGNSGRSNTDNFWARNANVGLTSKEWGTVKLGRNTTTLFVAALNFNAFGDSFGYSPTIRHIFTSGTVTGDSGWSDSVLYTTPNYSGFTASAFVAAGEGSGGRNVAASGTYVNGPLAGALVYQKVQKDAAVDDTSVWMANGSYDFGAVKLFGQYAKAENLTRRVDYKIYEVGASVPIGAGKLLAQYGEISPSAGAGRKTWTVGYDYWLSKRTDVYLVGMSDKIEGLAAGNSVSLGMRHRF
ncbi:porin [Roseateles asaccharophilus]|uniref:Porin n=1 Tax=Roseateles asaccharophilus TaxID=582607 RepID=A0ABU2A8K3_9BURK|nr:porin [Roseateles asaccharophilus]MDR7333531.1 putative porin [Roseateles asaccharophilus]